MRLPTVLLIISGLAAAGVCLGQSSLHVWDVFELTMTARRDGKSYVDSLPEGGAGLVKVVFTGVAATRQDPHSGWDGGRGWKVRFAPCRGEWSYKSVSDDAGLNGGEGAIACNGRS